LSSRGTRALTTNKGQNDRNELVDNELDTKKRKEKIGNIKKQLNGLGLHEARHILQCVNEDLEGHSKIDLRNFSVFS
jgi:hypothetical protein